MNSSPKSRDVHDRFTQLKRQQHRTTISYACMLCPDQHIFATNQALWDHVQSDHLENLPEDRGDFEAKCAQKTSRPTKDDSQRKPNLNDANRAGPEPPPSKRPHSNPLPPARSISGLGALHLGTEDVDMQDVSDEALNDQRRKRTALADGASIGSASPRRESSASPQPRRSKATRPTSAPFTTSDADMSDSRPVGPRKQLWTEQDAPLTRSSVDPSNIASNHAQRARRTALNPPRQPRAPQPTTQATRTVAQAHLSGPNRLSSGSTPAMSMPMNDEVYDIILQPETRPISQEQLVAEVKGIYAGLVMVEAKCIEVDNKQATLAQGDPQSPPKLNNEQWQALIALHRTLLHEHHDFFLASQHPSASPALRRLASKYAMPARMWRHGIHSFLELLRHRLPASLDHMLAFIYLAYSMMALLYETVPAFEDTWIECLGDLGRYRMAIEDDDIRDREVWTGVARHWYSKASDKAPTTGRLYHHLAILARPNALQQLFYYSKALCVAVPFASARESILTLFNPVLDADSTHAQLRLPPFDIHFVRAHGLLFTNKKIETFEATKQEFLALLNNHIGRVTRKFLEQGYWIAIANCVAMTGFAVKDNILMQQISPTKDGGDVAVAMADAISEQSMATFNLAQGLSNDTLKIILQRIGDPNVLPFVDVMLAFMYNMTRYPEAIKLLEQDFPWDLLVILLNTLLNELRAGSLSCRIEAEEFPLPVMDDFQPFPEDFALRGVLWAENYFPDEYFTRAKVDVEEKDRELGSMREPRKERILWLACKVAKSGSWIQYDGSSFTV